MRARRTVGIVIIAVLLLGAAALVFRFRADVADAVRARTSPPPVQSAPIAAPADHGETPRGNVAIDVRRQQLIGVRTAAVERMTIAPDVRTTGSVRYDETRQVDVNVKLDGWIRDLYVDYTGQPVRTGERLFALYSPDVLATENELLLALRNRDEMQPSQMADTHEYAGRLVDAARQRLALWDVLPADIETIERTRQPLPAITVVAPAGGFVVEKTAVQGMHVAAGQTLYKLADISDVWVEADVYEQEMAFVRVGARASVTVDAYPSKAFTARAVYIYPSVDPQTRTEKVRFQLGNPEGLLKPGMFVAVQLQGTGHSGLTVPADAVLDSGTEQLVFVADGNGMFTPTHVKAGARMGDQIEITDGLKEGQQVATSATFFLDSESQLRAGTENYEPPAGSQGGAAAPVPQSLDITFRSQPDPPQTGDNTFEVHLADPAGKAVTDADVSVQLFMPAMPTMNMPAMRNETKLAPVGGGLYRGPGQVMMTGRWEATVNVARGGKPAGRKQFSLVTK